MGTNYYWEPQEPCECCKRPYDSVHIGKSSGGWCFSLHVADPRYSWDEHPKSLEEWQERWKTGRIMNEYGERVTPEKMIAIITGRSWYPRDGRTPFGYDSWEQFNASNGCIEGPSGLSRHKIDKRHCIGHGEGTWDLCVGEFS